MLPEDENEVSHEEFYAAIRSEDIQLLDTLLSKWSHVGSIQLDDILSRAYDDLKLKNVPLSHEIEIFVQNKLLDFRFFSNPSGQDQSIKSDLNIIKKRINLTLENINLLSSGCPKSEDVDEKFLFITKFIAKNVHILKGQLRSTYSILPWEEIEFCLVIFVSIHEKLQEMNLFYRATLNKSKMLKYLTHFAKHLEKVIIQSTKLHCIPRIKRDNVVSNIINSCSKFEDLYNDYQQIRDVYSLQKMSDYISLALSTDHREKEGQLIITRVLQVIGENLKNTLESPKLSYTTSQLLIISLRTNSREIIMDLRDSISHADYLMKRIEIEKKADVDFCNIQNDLRKVGEAITVILYKQKIKKMSLLLETLVNSVDLDEVVEVLKDLSALKLNEVAIIEDFKILERKLLEGIVQKLCDAIEDKTKFEEKLFNDIYETLNFAGTNLKNIGFNYVTLLANLESLNMLLSDNMNSQNLLRVVKNNAITALQNITSDLKPPFFTKINILAFEIFNSVESRKQGDKFDDNRKNNFVVIMYEISHMLAFATGLLWIEKFREKLKKEDSLDHKTVSKSYPNNMANNSGYATMSLRRTMDTERENNMAKDECNKQFQLKLLDLNNILSKNSIIIEQISLYKSEKNLQAALEMLLLDIMSILGISKDYLKNNALFTDDNTPLLHGKCLRNHLAHDNAIVDILSDSSTALILNAKIISTKENIIMDRKNTIGKLIDDNPEKLRQKFHQGLVTIMNQREMFDALKDGNLESLESCLKKGADIKARSINSWTTLHFAAKESSLEVIKFILDQNISVNVKDNEGQTSLHIAAAYGRQNIVDFLIKEKGLNVDEVNNRGRTPLHCASQNGHKETVEFLLKHKANAVAPDCSGFPPLHYAIRNNHIDIVKILLEKYISDDINKTMGGFAPLHEAAENGSLQLVNLLLKNGADVNVIGTRKNDVVPSQLRTAAFNDNLVESYTDIFYEHTPILKERDIYGFTPLHCAAENGHDEIVEILLENGACVYAIDKDYATPLHYAASYGYERVVNLLLKNNANADAPAVKERTPLHIAVWSGHLETVAALINHGVDIHAKDIYKNTALHAAATSGHRDIAKLLINNGSEINAKTIKDITALHVATLLGNEDVADLLITENADVNALSDWGSSALIAAVMNGNTYTINLLIKKNAKVNIRTNSGNTPLHYATKSGHIDAVKILIKNNADVNATDNDDLCTSLHFAAEEGSIDIINHLIDSKAKIDSVTKDGMSPLHIAASTGNTTVLDLLKRRNAQINIKSVNGRTPLHTAAINGHVEAVDYLMKNKANVNATDNDDWTPSLHAAHNGYEHILSLLIDGGAQINAEEFHTATLAGKTNIIDLLIKRKADVNIRAVNGSTPLHQAILSGQIEVVDFLIKGNADVNAAKNDGWTPLHYAASGGRQDIVNLLVDNNAQIDTLTYDGRSPLHIAATTGNTTVLDLLIKKNAEVNIRAVNGHTPLLGASDGGHMEAVDFLINCNADVNATDNDDWTPLHFAASIGHEHMVNLLINNGAKVNAAENLGNTPLHIAATVSKINIIDLLIKKSADVNIKNVDGSTPLHLATAGGYKDIVDFLIKSNADVNATGSNGLTSLHYAACQGHEHIINLLIDSGIQVNAGDKFGFTPLHAAAITGKANIIDLLINKNAEVNTRTDNGRTPLHCATKYGHIDAVDILIKCHADVNVAEENGLTPLHLAASEGHEDIVKLLINNGAQVNAAENFDCTPLRYMFSFLRKYFGTLSFIFYISVLFIGFFEYCELY